MHKWGQFEFKDNQLEFKSNDGDILILPEFSHRLFKIWKDVYCSKQMYDDIDPSSLLLITFRNTHSNTVNSLSSGAASNIISRIGEKAGVGKITARGILMTARELRDDLPDLF